MLRQMLRVIRMDASVYPEIINDPNGTRKATMIVAIVAIAGFIGSALKIAIGDMPKGTNDSGFILGTVAASIIQWILWSYLTYFIGTTFFKGKSTPSNMMRALGYAKAPQIFSILGFIPTIGPVIVIISNLIALRSGSLAAGGSLGVTTGKAIATMVVSFVIAFLLANLVKAVLGNIGVSQSMTSP